MPEMIGPLQVHSEKVISFSFFTNMAISFMKMVNCLSYLWSTTPNLLGILFSKTNILLDPVPSGSALTKFDILRYLYSNICYIEAYGLPFLFENLTEVVDWDF